MEMDNSSPMPARLLCVLIQRCAVMLQGDNGLGRPRSRPAFLAFSQHLVPKLNESAYATYLQGAELERDITTIWYYAIQLYLQSLDRPLNPQSGAAMPAVDSKTQAAKNILELFQAFHKRQALAEWQPSPKDENHLISVSSLADFSPHCVQELVSGDKTGVVGYAIEALSRLSDSKKQEAQASNRLGPLYCVKSTWPIKTLLFFCGVIACAGTLLYLNVGLSVCFHTPVVLPALCHSLLSGVLGIVLPAIYVLAVWGTWHTYRAVNGLHMYPMRQMCPNFYNNHCLPASCLCSGMYVCISDCFKGCFNAEEEEQVEVELGLPSQPS